MTLDQYIENLNSRYILGNATEHTFRGELTQLIETLVPGIKATNEPKRQECGAPDYILTKNDIPIGFIEAKDIGDRDLSGQKRSGNKLQFDRYKASLDNVIFTDYLEFHFYQAEQFVTKISIGKLAGKIIVAEKENFGIFRELIAKFCERVTESIKSPKQLAKMMAGKSKLLSEIIEKVLTADQENEDNSTLRDQLEAFRSVLIHDITPKGFADVYAQTIAYGMFAARLHDATMPTFTRQEAAELIPKSNPFLRKLFGYIAGPDIDDRIRWIVDNLASVFLACNVSKLLKKYGRATKQEDPIIHFYETFLREYDPKLRKMRGVWYTPAPVVNFLIRAVDDILKAEFQLKDGLADISKTKIKINLQETDRRYKGNVRTIEEEVHKVQILDPATGTGTFLAEVVKQIFNSFSGQQGLWSNYVKAHLLPRLNGFELLMASYAMAHLKLDLLLTETGYQAIRDQRFRIYLTNSLEEHHPDTGTLFANWLSSEANEANRIKRDAPIMCVIGNPPYSGESANKGIVWIDDLMNDYKCEPGTELKLREKNSKWINADEYKFIRYAQHFIEKKGSGIIAYINPHGYLDNPTFRGMRWKLLRTFDKIYILDLHGNVKKREVNLDGSQDDNVFDIEQGVAINIFIKNNEKKPSDLAKVFHADLFGKRESKYDFLFSNSIDTIEFVEVLPKGPQYAFKPKGLSIEDYDDGFSIQELFPIYSLGLLTKRDNLSIDFTATELENKIKYFLDETKSVQEVCNTFGLLIKDNDKWDANKTRSSVGKRGINSEIRDIQYRPFDNRKVFYNSYFVARQNKKVLGHFENDNIGLIVGRQGQAVGAGDWNVVFCCQNLVDQNIFRRGGGTVFPLYIYSNQNGQQSINGLEERRFNLDNRIISSIAERLNLTFDVTEKSPGMFSGKNILEYVYAVLHSSSYRRKYSDYLKTEFPKIPYPVDQQTFWGLTRIGGDLLSLHLSEKFDHELIDALYPVDGSNLVVRVEYSMVGNESPEGAPHMQDQKGHVYINDTQYFANVPKFAWEFEIGGYKPAQKWLKERRDRKLEYEDIIHYQRIIQTLTRTGLLMRKIDALITF